MLSTVDGVIGDIVAGRATTDDGEKSLARPSSVLSGLNSVSVGDLNVKEPRQSPVADHKIPTGEEDLKLRKVAGKIPWISFSLCLVEFAERASYYGSKTVFSNFIQRPLPIGGNGAGAPPRYTQKTAGALGLGLQAASGLTLMFSFLAYVVPIFGGWLADTRTGRFKAILYGVIICGIAHIVQIVGAIPSVLQRGPGSAAPPFIIGLLLLALGAGIFKPNVAPLILDQNRQQTAYIKTLGSGERVIVDPEVTTTRTMLLFYASINVGAFFILATTYSEKYVGFWLSFLEAGAIYFLLPVLLTLIYQKLYKIPPAGSSDLNKFFRIVGLALRRNKFKVWKKDFWNAAKPSILANSGVAVDWTDQFVDDVRRTISVTSIFCYFPIWYLNDGGIGSVANNQGASMTTNGAPNDLLNNFNPLTILVAVPFLSYILYPTFSRVGIKFGRITRITCGFVFATAGSTVAAIVQWRVYKTSPCGYHASNCNVSTGVSPISIWWQIPTYVLSALSECLCNVTAYELAYARAPSSMRGLVMAMFLFMSALSSAIGEILIPVTKDPYLIWIWAAPAVALAVQTGIFWWRFRGLNDDEFMTRSVRDEIGNVGNALETRLERNLNQDCVDKDEKKS